jgi:CheY-like chemotaxis protein
MAIYHSAQHLSDLINDVLDLSRLEAGRLPLIRELTNLAVVIQEAVEMVRGLVEAKGLRIEMDLPPELPSLYLDRVRIRQVLLNLLTNATRFTDAGWIRVRVTPDDRDVVVTVEDSGQGIPAERLAQAFEAFSQLDEDRAREGSGLGLAVSKRFVELHDGRMWIESELGHGTQVSFSLPLASNMSQGASLLRGCIRPAGPASQEPQVLVLHDDPRILHVLRRHVHGCHFSLASSREQASEAIGIAPPAVVIMDSGWNEYASGTPVQALPPGTPLLTCPLPSLRRAARFLGACDFISKPVSREDLEEALARLPRPPQTALIVDDNAHVVRLLARMLRACAPSLRVWETFGGQEGLAIARAQHPDVVLLDLVMPEVTGYDFLAELQRDGALADVQVIIVSVHAFQEEEIPLRGEVRLQREAGFALSDVLQLLQVAMPVLTRPATVFPVGAAAAPASFPG